MASVLIIEQFLRKYQEVLVPHNFLTSCKTTFNKVACIFFFKNDRFSKNDRFYKVRQFVNDR